MIATVPSHADKDTLTESAAAASNLWREIIDEAGIFIFGYRKTNEATLAKES